MKCNPQPGGPIRRSIKLSPADWKALDRIARATGSVYRGRPSWRTMLRQIARGRISVLLVTPTGRLPIN